MLNTNDLLKIFKEKYKNGEFRIINDDPKKKTVEIQNAHFVADKDWILRKPDYEYARREIAWYDTMSLYIKDIPDKIPIIWKDVCDINGKINSNYGWCIYSEENGSQYKNCLYNLSHDSCSRQGVMIYNRPSMHNDSIKNHMHDFMCTFATQCFLNKCKDGYDLKYIVYQRSCDAIFGFNSDHLWHKEVQKRLANDLEIEFNKKKKEDEEPIHIHCMPIEFNCGSIHVYSRHFNFLEDNEGED